MDSTATIFARLTSSVSVSQRLAEFEGDPAIFDDSAPDDYVFSEHGEAVIVIAIPSQDDDASTLTETIRAVTQDVRVYARRTGSNEEIDQLARDIRDLFHLKAAELSVDGGTVTIATATGPVAAPTTDPSLIGRRVVVRLELQEN